MTAWPGDTLIDPSGKVWRVNESGCTRGEHYVVLLNDDGQRRKLSPETVRRHYRRPDDLPRRAESLETIDHLITCEER